ncbi:MAG: DUF1295 domain-containing protein [Deltaproteobacteria bacterium]|nr:DUF1295 domain-containing protein [Deltaproteobacteria bacterium]
MAATLLIGWAGLLAGAFLLWLLSLRLKNAGIVDIFWGLGFVGLTWFAHFHSNSPGSTESAGPAQWLHLVLVTIWGVRLAGYIGWRNHGQSEDYRYAAMRERHGRSFWWVSLFTVFLLQATLVAALGCLLVIVQTTTPRSVTPWDLLGAGLWSVGFLFESVGDAQLHRFKADPRHRGQVLDRGLWRYTRHPNYFGEALLWWGYAAFALGSAGSIWTLWSPLVMTLLLLKVSGVALLEKTIVERRPGYRQYIESTNAFLPWFPKRDPS